MKAKVVELGGDGIRIGLTAENDDERKELSRICEFDQKCDPQEALRVSMVTSDNCLDLIIGKSF